LHNVTKLNFSCEIKRGILRQLTGKWKNPGLSEFSDVSYLGTKRFCEISASHELCNVEVSEKGAFSGTSTRVRAKRDGRFIKTKTVRLRIDATRSNAELRKAC
jgi:hypothetical protein